MKYVVEVAIIIEADTHEEAMDQVDNALEKLYRLDDFEVNSAWPLEDWHA